MDSWTFLGAVDDVVFKYPHNYKLLGKPTPSPIDILVDYALFGPPVIVHQSALLQQPELVMDLLKREDSVIFNMIRHDRLRVLSRNKDFSGWPQQAKKVGVNTYQKGVDEKEFTANIEGFQDLLDDQGKGLLGMPRTDCSAMMHKLLMSIIQGSGSNHDLGLTTIPDDNPVLGRVLQSYQKRYEKDFDVKGGASFPPTRTHWEEAVHEIIGLSPSDWARQSWKCQLMTLANECHHIAHGMCIASEVESPISLNTVLSNRFVGVYDLPSGQSPRGELVSGEEFQPSYFRYDRNSVKANFRKFSDALYDPRTALGAVRTSFRISGITVDAQSMRENKYELVYLREINGFLGLPEPEGWDSPDGVRACDTAVSTVFSAALASLGWGTASAWDRINSDRANIANVPEGAWEAVAKSNRRKFIMGAGISIAASPIIPYLTSTFSSAICDEIHYGEEAASGRLSDDRGGNWVPIIESTFKIDRDFSKDLSKTCFRYDLPPESPMITQDVDL